MKQLSGMHQTSIQTYNSFLGQQNPQPLLIFVLHIHIFCSFPSETAENMNMDRFVPAKFLGLSLLFFYFRRIRPFQYICSPADCKHPVSYTRDSTTYIVKFFMNELQALKHGSNVTEQENHKQFTKLT
jgi:hypothetical protein